MKSTNERLNDLQRSIDLLIAQSNENKKRLSELVEAWNDCCEINALTQEMLLSTHLVDINKLNELSKKYVVNSLEKSLES
jgi:hypothetical protein